MPIHLLYYVPHPSSGAPHIIQLGRISFIYRLKWLLLTFQRLLKEEQGKCWVMWHSRFPSATVCPSLLPIPLVLWMLFSLLISSTSSTALILLSVKCTYYAMPSTPLPRARRGEKGERETGLVRILGFLQSLGGCLQWAEERGAGFEGQHLEAEGLRAVCPEMGRLFVPRKEVGGEKGGKW